MDNDQRTLSIMAPRRFMKCFTLRQMPRVSSTEQPMVQCMFGTKTGVCPGAPIILCELIDLPRQ